MALVAPTTLLVRQHFTTFSERFRGLPFKISQLSRIVKPVDATQVRAEIANGVVDIAIGTHALLSESVTFKRLGLIIIDEEQSFGVVQKERLKRFLANIHVLTLTATPIPRTLQLAMSGVKDLSIIKSPPVDRLAIRTYMSEFDPVTIRDALIREYNRKGQTFFVVPRIKDLPEIESFLTEYVPEVSFVIAHGRLASSVLEERTGAFYDGKFDVLLSTTIIASGLDIPTANTIVIHKADRFGLAQLHQIRGRVGRSGLRAYAFITYGRRSRLTEGAQSRLRVLGNLDSLGAGFSLASQDLGIRGAGNILGDAQSGHVREVGFELYQKMLEEAISRIKSGEGLGAELPEDEWTPQLNLGVAVMIPESYVQDLDIRLGLYRRLAALSDRMEIEVLPPNSSIDLVPSRRRFKHC